MNKYLRFLVGRLEPYRANAGVADFFDAAALLRCHSRGRKFAYEKL